MGDPRQDGIYDETPTDRNEEFNATIVAKPQDGFGSRYGCAAHILLLQINQYLFLQFLLMKSV